MASPRPPSSPSFRSLQTPQPASNVSAGEWNPLKQTSLYVGDLDPDVTEDDIYNKFSAVAPVLSLRLCRCLRTGKSLCYAYVNFYSNHHASTAFCRLNHTDLKGKPVRIMWSHRDPFPRKFASEESAMAAMTALHDTMLKGKKLYVSKFVRKSERTTAGEEKFTNLYVKNLLDDMTEDRLREMFSGYGKIGSVVIMKDDKGVSRGFGFVNFQSPDDAKKALEAMNGVQFGSKNLFVGRAQKKAERTKLLKQKYKDVFDSRFETKASNLYVKNLNISIDDKRLQEIFGRFGRITSARVMRHENGTSKGFGFVCFSSHEEAMAALQGLDGDSVDGKFLYVAVAQHKEDRCKVLRSYYMQNTPVQISYQSSCNGRTPQFHPFYFNFPPCPVASPHMFQPSLYQHHFVANVGIQYPFTTTDEHDQMRHLQPSTAGVGRDWMYGQHAMTYNSNVRIRELDLVNSGNKKVGFRKRENKATQFVTAATSPGNSYISRHSFVGNLKPKLATEESGQPMEMNSDVIKLLNSPNSLAVKDKPVQELKEANDRTGIQAATFANLNSARCLGY